jgi:putative DNA primase/helicase
MGSISHDDAAAARLTPPAFSEDALALLLADIHADKLRYIAKWHQWMRFDGKKWGIDETASVFSMARLVCREAATRVNKPKEAKALASNRTKAAVVTLASDDRRLAATADQWDMDPWLLNTPGGVVELQTGRMREHRPEDYMTKITAVAPDGQCPTPLWSKFLKTVTANNKELADYLQLVFGYGLTGCVDEHQLWFFFGLGRNGKGVLMRTVAGILDEYHQTAAIETFTASDFDRHPTELAMLRGARLVSVSETEEGRRWAEKRILQLTGGDPITARFMRQDFFEYYPQFKLTIYGNHKPGLRAVTQAVRRRYNLVPFMVTIPEAEQDTRLTEKLKAEWPGILAWMIEGCLAWQKNGLPKPACVSAATEDYLGEQDSTQMFLDEVCELGSQHWEATDSLFRWWKHWTEERGEYVGTQQVFSQALEAKGLIPERRLLEGKKRRGYRGVALQIRLELERPSPWKAEKEKEREREREQEKQKFKERMEQARREQKQKQDLADWEEFKKQKDAQRQEEERKREEGREWEQHKRQEEMRKRSEKRKQEAKEEEKARQKWARQRARGR